MSRNRNAADVIEHTASFTLYDQTVTGGALGNPTEAQQNNGYDQPNVQAAIDDLWNKVLLVPGTVYTSLSSINPAVAPTSSTSQAVQLTLSGTPSASGNLTIAGINVAILNTDTAATAATKVAAALAAQPYISSASAAGAVVSYAYVDTNVHPVDNKVQLGITMVSKTTTLGGQPGYLGYGSWELLGSETKYTRTFYSWLRVA